MSFRSSQIQTSSNNQLAAALMILVSRHHSNSHSLSLAATFGFGILGFGIVGFGFFGFLVGCTPSPTILPADFDEQLDVPMLPVLLSSDVADDADSDSLGLDELGLDELGSSELGSSELGESIMHLGPATRLVQTNSDGPELIPAPKGVAESEEAKAAEKAKAEAEAKAKADADAKAAEARAALEQQKQAEEEMKMAAADESKSAEPKSPDDNGSVDLVKLTPGGSSNSENSKPSGPDADASKPNVPNQEPGQPESYESWEKPRLTLVFTGNQHGYIEPCGCTGLDRQKGGVARRYSFLEILRDKGWPIVPMDAGNQVRRYGRQAAIKLQQSVRALTEMKYEAVGFGPEDVRLGVGDLLYVAASDSPEEALYISANVTLFDPEMLPKTKLIQREGIKLGVTSITDPATLEVDPGEELTVGEMVSATRAAMKELSSKSPDFNVLLFFGKEDSAKELVQQVPGFDLVVVAGGYGEPTYQATSIEGSKTKMILTGNKGMYAGLVGLYFGSEMKYARVALTHEFKDAPPMRGLMKDYQDQLKNVGLEGLGLMPPIPHSSGNKFVGTATCGKCHTTAMAIWDGSPHAHATDSIVEPPEDRGDVARHFDPECISCHVTGWNPQEYYPYESGYLSLESTAHLTGSGCENCHGPGAEHSAAEEEGSKVSEELRDQLRESMQLPLSKAREKCMQCHDLDNSPDFHEPDAFLDVYWPQIEHEGMD